MGMWEVIYTVDVQGGTRELAREATGDIPARGDEIYIEQYSRVIEGGHFTVTQVRRVLSETGTADSTARGAAGGAVDVVARCAYVRLERIPDK